MKQLSQEKKKELEEISRPLVKFLNENYQPHAKIIIENDRVEVMVGAVGLKIEDYIPH